VDQVGVFPPKHEVRRARAARPSVACQGLDDASHRGQGVADVGHVRTETPLDAPSHHVQHREVVAPRRAVPGFEQPLVQRVGRGCGPVGAVGGIVVQIGQIVVVVVRDTGVGQQQAQLLVQTPPQQVPSHARQELGDGKRRRGGAL